MKIKFGIDKKINNWYNKNKERGKMNKIDNKVLLDLFHAPAQSGFEVLTQEYIKSFLEENETSYEEDEMGNIFKIEEGKPLLVAHMDTVQDVDDVALANFIRIRGQILSGYGVIGGDDKNGIYIILHLLKEGYDINFAFVVEEEIGGHGSYYLSNTHYKEIEKCLYGIVLDRRGAGDIICYNNNYGTKIFQDRLQEVGKDFGYSPGTGTFSDADQLDEIISCANLSVGYHNPHSKIEFIHLGQLENALNYTRNIVEKVKSKYAPSYISMGAKTKTKKTKNSFYNSYYFDDYDDGFDSFDDYLSSFDDKKDMCVFCGNKKQVDINYLASLEQYVCNDCVLKFYEDTYDLAHSAFISDEEMGALVDSFSGKK